VTRTQEEWIKIYQNKGALWLHDGDPKRPHALLTSLKHSDGFFNSELVIEDSGLLDQAASDLVQLLELDGLHPKSVDRVVGPAMGAITLAHDIARNISRVSREVCLRGYTVKVGEKPNQTMQLDDRVQIRPGERILLAEDVITTFGSVQAAGDVMITRGAEILPYAAALVNRSGQAHFGHIKVIALINKKMTNWEAHECPLCKEGSEAIKPKLAGNWKRLTAD